MKVYAVFHEYVGVDGFEMGENEVRVFLDREKAEKCLDSYLIGPDSQDIDDARIFEYEVEE